ncbi:hypothetical protein D9758_003420 [Tetrapyrgos nigripes]|uniref:Uncharacterized protein n=1 Tax=Tetrapyrgos nigripes TaxID=182062 RepID=A0A8H5GV87_9AGAR|nr:hypothetical protein D9758_003420 [Tetrapyrgos nigripes]
MPSTSSALPAVLPQETEPLLQDDERAEKEKIDTFLRAILCQGKYCSNSPQKFRCLFANLKWILDFLSMDHHCIPQARPFDVTAFESVGDQMLATNTNWGGAGDFAVLPSDQSCKSINLVYLAISAIVIPISTGFWSRLGDKLGSRSTVLATILLCLALLDLVTIGVLAFSPVTQNLPMIWMVVVQFCEGLLGGTATVHSLTLAYAADVSSPNQRALMFTLLPGFSLLAAFIGQMLSTLLFNWSSNLLFASSCAVILSVLNISYVLSFLSLPITSNNSRERASYNFHGLKDFLKTAFSFFTVLAPGVAFERAGITWLGVALFAHSLTTYDAMLKIVSVYFPHYLKEMLWFMLLLTILEIVSLVIILPIVIYRYCSTRMSSPFPITASRTLAALLAFGTTALDLLGFISSSHQLMFILFGIVFPGIFSIGIPPLLFAIGTLYIGQPVGQDSNGGFGFVLGGLIGLERLGQVIAQQLYYLLNQTGDHVPKEIYLFTPALLGTVGVLLLISRKWDGVADGSRDDWGVVHSELGDEETSALAPSRVEE